MVVSASGERTLRQRFSGTLHVFAVSGLHVGIVAAVVWFAATAGAAAG